MSGAPARVQRRCPTPLPSPARHSGPPRYPAPPLRSGTDRSTHPVSSDIPDNPRTAGRPAVRTDRHGQAGEGFRRRPPARCVPVSCPAARQSWLTARNATPRETAGGEGAAAGRRGRRGAATGRRRDGDGEVVASWDSSRPTAGSGSRSGPREACNQPVTLPPEPAARVAGSSDSGHGDSEPQHSAAGGSHSH